VKSLRQAGYPGQPLRGQGSPVEGFPEKPEFEAHRFRGVVSGVHFQKGLSPGEEEVRVWGRGVPVRGDFPGEGTEPFHGLRGEQEVVEEVVREFGHLGFRVDVEDQSPPHAVGGDFYGPLPSTFQG